MLTCSCVVVRCRAMSSSLLAGVNPADFALRSTRSLLTFVGGSARYYASHPSVARTELLSGVSLAAMGLPQAVSYALLAGMPAQAGLTTAALLPIVCGIITARTPMISSTAGATAALIVHLTAEAGPLSHLPLADRQQFLAPVLLLCAAIQLVCGLSGAARQWLRLCPHTVLMGFMCGLSIIIARSQFDTFQRCPAGIRFEQCGKADREWLPLSEGVCWLTILHVVLAFAVMLLFPRIPRIGKIIPGSFAAILIGTVMEEAFVRGAGGSSTRNVGDSTTLLNKLPTWNSPVMPASASSSDVGTMIQYAITLAVISLIESLLTVSSVARLLKEKPSPVHADIECISQAAGNLVCSVFGGQGGCGIIGPTVVAVLNGSRNRLGAIVAGLTMLLIMGAAGPAISLVPIATLTGILFAMVSKMFEWSVFPLLLHGRTLDRLVVVLVIVLGVVWDLAFAVLIGCGLAALDYAYNTANEFKVTQQAASSDVAELRPMIVQDPVDGAEPLPSPSPSSAQPLLSSPELISGAIDADAAVASSVPSIVAGVKLYTVAGLISYVSIPSVLDQFTPDQDPAIVQIDFRAARVLDHSSLYGLRDLLLAYRALNIRVQEYGFDHAARGLRQWRPMFAPAAFDPDGDRLPARLVDSPSSLPVQHDAPDNHGEQA